MRNFTFSPKSVPFVLLLLCLVSFGLLIPWLGFYWDDWPAIWFLHLLGPAGFASVFTVDRPLLGRIFMLTTPWLGTSIIGWQLFGVFARWLSCLAFLWTLHALWPSRIREITLTAMLFTVYPGFKQQFISVTYANAWLIILIFILSLGTMLYALRRPRLFWPLMLLSWLLAGFTLFTDEYFFGLELLRPVFLWLIYSEQGIQVRQRLKRVTLLWLPYLALMVAFLVWRLVLHETPRGQVSLFGKLIAKPLVTSIQLAQEVILDMLEASLGAWAQTLDFVRLTSYGTGPTILYIVATLLAVGAIILYLAKFQPALAPDSKASKGRWSRQSFLIGFLALSLGGIPFWTTNLPIGLEFPWDRFTLAMMFGASLFVSALLHLVSRTRLVYILTFGITIGLATGLHIQYGNLYRREWNAQKQLFWQLTWRAPGIQPGTLLLTSELPFIYFSDNSLTAPLNWIYAPDLDTENMPYLIYAAEARLGNVLPDFDPGIPVRENYRATVFSGSTSKALVMIFNPPGCVKIIDPQIDARMPQKPNYLDDMLSLSDISLIITDVNQPARPPQNIFGSEPEHRWCYYFEKADLARQRGDWQQVVRLAEQAFRLDERLYEVNAPELLPYLEGYAQTGQWEQAQKLTQQAMSLSARMQRMLCANWLRIEQDTQPSDARQAVLAQVRQELQCNFP